MIGTGEVERHSVICIAGHRRRLLCGNINYYRAVKRLRTLGSGGSGVQSEITEISELTEKTEFVAGAGVIAGLWVNCTAIRERRCENKESISYHGNMSS
jgi:hypothetical protein